MTLVTRRLQDMLADCMLRDRYRLKQRLRKWEAGASQGASREDVLANIEQAITDSVACSVRRRAGLPNVTYPEALPITQRVEDIRNAIIQHQVVIVAGETGSGKTTQLPKICLSLGRGVAGMIGHTQARRLAARSIAARIAQELKSDIGAAVGYKVRFTDKVSQQSYLKLMTDGILLAEIQGDRYLNDYDTLIIDEAHERSLNIDFLLGYLKQLLPRRPDLKLIITSATIDTERFARHFDNAPVIEVSGRTYPVEVRYRPLVEETEADGETAKDTLQGILDAVDELTLEDKGQGNILIFFSGERDIREAAEALRKHHPPQTEILPLYARLSAAEQNRVFTPAQHRRIVLSTNVAETSLTVPGIHYVIDTGSVRISRYSYRSKIQRLPIEPISQSSANQRKGRCGRLSDGICIRLYSEDDFNSRAEFTEPEIKRTNLASVILQMESLRLGQIEDFPFIEPPDTRYIKDGYRLLHELGAVDRHNRITELGRNIARLPVDPRIGRMLLSAQSLNCLNELLIIGSALSLQDPRERPVDKQQQADEKHRLFLASAEEQQTGKPEIKSDFLFYLHLWQVYNDKRRHLSRNQLRKFCRQHFLSCLRMEEWRDIHRQLSSLFTEKGIRLNQDEANYEDIHRALLSGLLGNIGNKALEGNDYLGARGIRFYIHPGSWLVKKSPRWIMCGELVETTRLYARMVAQIEPEWIEPLAPHLIKRSYSEPHWEKRPAQVAAFERTSLYGLTVCPKRRVNYGPIDPLVSRELFIREALVHGELHTRAGFFSHNQSLLEDIESLEAKGRRRDILVDEQSLYAFYDERIPDHIYNGKAFEKWLKQAQQADADILYLRKQDLMRHDADEISEAHFPNTLTLNGVLLNLEYHFEPGHAADGVTAIIPLALLGQLQPEMFDWLVPGLLRDKVIALIKTLPKAIRKLFVPVPDYADTFLQSVTDQSIPLVTSLAAYLQKSARIEIPVSAFQWDHLPEFYRMNFKVVDQHGKLLGAGRDLSSLQDELGDISQSSLTALPAHGIERDRVTQWDFGDLPEFVELEQQGMKIRAWPALVDEGQHVAIRLFNNELQARQQMFEGLRRLFRLSSASQMKYLNKNLPHLEKMCLHYASLGSREKLIQDLETAIIDTALFTDANDIRKATLFNERTEIARRNLVQVANGIAQLVNDILEQHHQLARRLQGTMPLAWFDAVRDIRQQLSCLIFPGFISVTPRQWLQQMPRFLKAVSVRLEKLQRTPAVDKQRQRELQPHWDRVHHKIGVQPGVTLDPLWERYRWSVEEMRVSLFAQELKTSIPVSIKKLGELYREINKP